MQKVMLLFSDHTWFACYEHQIKEFILCHKWQIKGEVGKEDRYVFIYKDREYEKITLEELRNI